MKKKHKRSAWTPTDEWEAPRASSSEEGEKGEPALSYEETQLLRARLRQSGEDRSQLPPHDSSDRAHILRFARKNKLVSAAALIILLAIVATAALGVFWFVSYLDSRPNRSAFTVYLGENDPYVVPYSQAVRDDGVLYIDMVRVAEFTDAMIISGIKTNRKFTASDGTSLRFENGSEIARINGERVEMKIRPLGGGKSVVAKAEVTETECWIPYEFLVQTVSEGLRFRLDSETNTISIKHIHYMEDDDRENALPASILFHLGGFVPLPTLADPPEYEWSYTIQIDPYLDAITTENLLLANKRNPLGEGFKPVVVNLTCATDGETQQLQAAAATALYAMMEELKTAGVTDLYVTSAYRSYAQQNYLFNNYVKQHVAQDGMSQAEAEAYVATYSARPGQSEHQTGLCLDFTTQSIHGELNNQFANTDAFRWLSENAYKFGFILRYPEDKVDVTEYSYESWHYRFVGREAATEMFFNGLCLEEYLGETVE